MLHQEGRQKLDDTRVPVGDSKSKCIDDIQAPLSVTATENDANECPLRLKRLLYPSALRSGAVSNSAIYHSLRVLAISWFVCIPRSLAAHGVPRT